MQDSGPTYRFIVRRGPQPNQTFELSKDVVTLGRDITNDIVINDPEVSRHHLRITSGTDGYILEDLGSTNGTFIQGQRISGVRPLKRGELIGLGETVTLAYEVVRPESGASPTLSSPASPQPQQPAAQQPPSPASPQPQQPAAQQPPSPAQQPAGDDYYNAQPSPPPAPDYSGGGYDEGVGNDYGAGYGGTPQAPPNYDYDPYAVREEEPVSAWRWVVIGCAGLMLFCCCATILGVVIIDTGDLWCDIPIFSDIVTPIFGLIGEALGLIDNARIC